MKAKLIHSLVAIGILLILSVACKKKKPSVSVEDSQQSQTPKQDTAPIITCQTKHKLFEGRYSFVNGGGVDTIDIIYKGNNCPTEYSNNYTVIGLHKAIKGYIKSNQVVDYNVGDFISVENPKEKYRCNGVGNMIKNNFSIGDSNLNNQILILSNPILLDNIIYKFWKTSK